MTPDELVTSLPTPYEWEVIIYVAARSVVTAHMSTLRESQQNPSPVDNVDALVQAYRETCNQWIEQSPDRPVDIPQDRLPFVALLLEMFAAQMDYDHGVNPFLS